MLQTFRKILNRDEGAVEFIETSAVLSVIIIMISLLIIVSMMTIFTIRDGEVTYSLCMDYLYNEKNPSFSSLSKTDYNNSYNFSKSKHIFSKKVNFKKNNNVQVEIYRVDTENLLRKVDFVNEVIEKVEERTGALSMVKSKLLQHKDSIKKFMGKANEK